MRILKTTILAATVMTTAASALAADPPGTPQRGGTMVFAISQGEPATFDCHATGSVNVMFRVAPHYSTLVKVDAKNYPKVTQDLAESWKVSSDGLSYEFKLFPNIKFHNGTPLTSADVKASFDRMRNPPQGVVSLRKEQLADIADITTPDSQTVVFKLSKPNASMLSILAMPYACIYSAKMMAEDPAYPAKKVMGSGPFKFVSYSPGGEWVGERFPGYFRSGLPYIDGFKALSLSPASTVNALSAGQVMLDFRGVSPAEAERVVVARGDKVKVFQADPAISLLFHVAVNTQKPPLNDVRVRQALALALDHWQGAKVIEKSSAISAVGGLLRPGSEFARSDAELSKLPGFSRDINASRTEAKRLLAEAGQTNLKLTFLNRRPWPFFGVYLIDQLRQIGVTVTQETPEDPLFFSRRASGSYDLVLDALPDYMDDPTVMWAPFNSFNGNPANFSRYNDPKIDALFERQSRTLQPKERVRIVRQMEEQVLKEAYVIPLFWGRRTTVVASELQGYVAAPTNYVGIDLTGFWLKK